MDVARERLRNQHVEGRKLARAADVVRMLVASQAQDFAGAKWALGLRMRDATDAAVEKDFDEGAILRTHLMRPTWHFVCPADIRWLLALTAPRVHAVNGHRYRALGLDGTTLSKATATLARALEQGRQLTRDELRLALTDARIATDGQRTAYLLMHAELEAVICSGARRGRQFTYALLDSRAPSTRTLDRDVALAELAARYFPTRGPATVHDFAKWSGLAVQDAREAVEAVASRLMQEVIDGTTFWSGTSGPAAQYDGSVAHLMSIYDEVISSYRDRSAMLSDPGDVQRLVGLGNALQFIVVVDGKIVGTWKRTFAKRTVHVEVAPFRVLPLAHEKAAAAAASRFTQFMGPGHVLHLKVQ